MHQYARLLQQIIPYSYLFHTLRLYYENLKCGNLFYKNDLQVKIPT